MMCAALGLLVVAPELGDAVLGDDRALLEAGHRLVEQRHDGRDVGLGVPRAQRDERLAAGRVQRADDEVGLAAEAGVDAGVDPRGVGLAEQVDLEGGVDRGHHPLLGDQAGVVGVLGAHHPHPVVAVEPVVELARAEAGTTR